MLLPRLHIMCRAGKLHGGKSIDGCITGSVQGQHARIALHGGLDPGGGGVGRRNVRFCTMSHLS